MEYTNEFLARVYGAYMGCNIIMPKSGRVAKLQGVDFDGAIIHLNDGEDHRNLEYFPFKLILTPLPEISDEDKEQAGRLILGKGTNNLTPSDFYNWGAAFCDDLDRDILSNYDDVSLKQSDYCLLTDFLRSKGYMIPFKGVDLFKAGIAIIKQ